MKITELWKVQTVHLYKSGNQIYQNKRKQIYKPKYTPKEYSILEEHLRRARYQVNSKICL